MLYWQRKSHSTWTAAVFNPIPARYFNEALDHMRGYTSGSYAQLRFWRDMLNPGILDPGVSQETSALDHVPRSHTQLAEWGTPESSSRLYDITREPAGSCFGGGGWGRGGTNDRRDRRPAASPTRVLLCSSLFYGERSEGRTHSSSASPSNAEKWVTRCHLPK